MGYKRTEDIKEFDEQAKRIQANTDEIFEKLKSKCNDEINLKEEFEIKENGAVMKHYELENGLHVYSRYDHVIVSEKDITRNIKKGAIRSEDYITLERTEQPNLYEGNDVHTILHGEGNIGGLSKTFYPRQGIFNIQTTGEHVDYLEPDDKNIFDLAENQLNRLSPERREHSEQKLMAFKKMVEKEIGEIEKQAESESKETEKTEQEAEIVEPEIKKIEPEAGTIEIENDRKDEKTAKIEEILAGIESLNLSKKEIDSLTETLQTLKTRQQESQHSNDQQSKEQEDEQQGE